MEVRKWVIGIKANCLDNRFSNRVKECKGNSEK
jgi:hypothetical protein